MSIQNILDLCESSGGIHKVGDLEQALDFAKGIALSHYENFPVASILMPKRQRQDVLNIYAFARVADDIADVPGYGDSEYRIAKLNEYEALLLDYVANERSEGNPIFISLAKTVNSLGLPLEPFQKLLKAFRMDCKFQAPRTWDELLNYCVYSANPVGELMLRVFDEYDDVKANLSDCVCTGLQLANFWQDLSVDLREGRNYIPYSVLSKYRLADKSFLKWKENENFVDCLNEIYDYTENLFEIGKDLVNLLKQKRLRIEIAAICLGGEMILNKTKHLSSDIIYKRPKIKKSEFFSIFIKSLTM
jgi:squalene synthase HpnC